MGQEGAAISKRWARLRPGSRCLSLEGLASNDRRAFACPDRSIRGKAGNDLALRLPSEVYSSASVFESAGAELAIHL